MSKNILEEYIEYIQKKKWESLELLGNSSREIFDEEEGTYMRVDDEREGFKRPTYKTKYHVNEVLKRICCTELNKPKIDHEKLKPGMTRHEIYKLLNYQERKSLIYIWCTLNNIKPLCIEFEQYNKIRSVLVHLTVKLGDMKKLPDYRLIIDSLCLKFGYEYVRPYLHFKENKKHRDKINNIYKDS